MNQNTADATLTAKPVAFVRPASTRDRFSRRRPHLALVHLISGGCTLAAFLGSGTFMLFHDPPLKALGAGPHVMFTSRHIYVLSGALIHLVLGSYVTSAGVRSVRLLQWAGSLFLLAASVLLVSAFLYEPVAGRYATSVSRLGLYSLFVGCVLHVGCGLRVRDMVLGNAPDEP